MNFYHLYKAWFFTGLFLFTACENADIVESPDYFPILEFPEGNPLTKTKIELGRKLFYERGLSNDSSISCGSCHKQAYAFADNSIYALGAHDSVGIRNTRGLTNAGFLHNFFGEGGLHSLERATIAPMQTAFEMNQNIKVSLDRLKANKAYLKDFKKAFNDEPNHQNVLWALASFQRTMISADSPYDHYYLGDSSALSDESKHGLRLFNSKRLGCNNCHSGILFTDEEAYNIGLYEENPDYGRGRLTLDSTDHGAFLTPTLRNVELTSPYMHDGSIASLEEVIRFYETGGKRHYAKSKKVKPFTLNDSERKALVSFLISLTDSSFITNPKFSDPN
jgi:cytochrome c peroxidase